MNVGRTARLLASWALIGLAAVMTACGDAPASMLTSIDAFQAEPESVARGAAVELTWRVSRAGTDANGESCSIARKVGDASFDDPVAVPCDGARMDVPPAPPIADGVLYRLRAVKRPPDPEAQYLTRDLVVTFVVPEVQVAPSSVTLAQGQSQAFSATVSGAVDTSVSWSATAGTIEGSDPSIIYTAPGTSGSHALTATSVADPNATATATITVAEVGISISPATATLKPDGSTLFTAMVSGATDTDVTWSATCGAFSGSGSTVTYVAPSFEGTCTVTATSVASPSATATATVAVEAGDAIGGVVIEPDAVEVRMGDTTQLTATPTGIVGSPDLSLTWSSDDETVALVDGDGTVTGVGVGTTQVTVRSDFDPSVVDTAVVSVIVVDVAIDPSQVDLLPYETTQFTATVTGPADTSVGWSATCGGIGGSGSTITFTAPSTPTTCVVTAASVAYPDQTATATITISTPPSGDVLWSRVVGSAAEERGLRIEVDARGHAVATGTTRGPWLAPHNGGTDVFAMAFDPIGTSQWSYQIGSALDDEPFATTFEADDDVLVAGRYAPSGSEDLALLRKTSLYGAFAWNRPFATEAVAHAASAMAILPDSTVVIAGSSSAVLGPGDPGGEDAFLVKYGPDSNQDWIARFGSGEAVYDYVRAVALASDGGVVVTGEMEKGQGYLTKIDAAGSLVWTTSDRRLDLGFDYYYLTINDVATGSDGGIYIVGHWDPPNVYAAGRGVVARYSATGSLDWAVPVGPSEGASVAAVAVDANGATVVVGSTSGVFGDVAAGDGFVAKYDASGGLVWVSSAAPGEAAELSDVALDAEGNALVVGTVNDDLFIAKLSP